MAARCPDSGQPRIVLQTHGLPLQAMSGLCAIPLGVLFLLHSWATIVSAKSSESRFGGISLGKVKSLTAGI